LNLRVLVERGKQGIFFNLLNKEQIDVSRLEDLVYLLSRPRKIGWRIFWFWILLFVYMFFC
jgi:hypothetical protein